MIGNCSLFCSHTTGTNAIFLRFYKTAAYGRFYSLFYFAFGRMWNLSVYMNFEKMKYGRDRLRRAHPRSTHKIIGDW